MCGFVGYINLKRNITNEEDIIKNMNSTLTNRGPDEYGYYIKPNILLGHRRLIVRDSEGR